MPMAVEFAPGLRYSLRPGRNDLQLPPGRYRAQLWCQYGVWQVGKATIDIDTTRGPVWFHYAAPTTIYHQGAAGFAPQQRAGGAATTMLVVGAVGVIGVMLFALFLAVVV